MPLTPWSLFYIFGLEGAGSGVFSPHSSSKIGIIGVLSPREVYCLTKCLVARKGQGKGLS